jgi:hypothetical protein
VSTKSDQLHYGAVAAIILIVACHGDAPAAPGTRNVDCVASFSVLGIAPITQQRPLTTIPNSGVARDKRFGDLSGAEMGKVCDLEACMGGGFGYGRDCYTPDRPSGPAGTFRLRTLPLIAGAMRTCYTTQPGTSPGWDSREDCVGIDRGQFANCRVGPLEDCDRETASGGYAPGRGPDCAQSCGGGATPQIAIPQVAPRGAR